MVAVESGGHGEETAARLSEKEEPERTEESKEEPHGKIRASHREEGDDQQE